MILGNQPDFSVLKEIFIKPHKFDFVGFCVFSTGKMNVKSVSVVLLCMVNFFKDLQLV